MMIIIIRSKIITSINPLQLDGEYVWCLMRSNKIPRH